jgi:predicted nucleotidyltransferase component of viral defense system
MDIHSRIRHIRTLTITALFSDDKFMEKFVLKGGGALDLIYQIDSRSSIDVDLSIPDDFDPKEIEQIQERVKDLLTNAFEENGYTIFDFSFEKRPHDESRRPPFWGGYSVEFKILPIEQKDKIKNDLDRARREALVVGFSQEKKFSVDISKYEYCKEKTSKEVNGFKVYAYTPKMLVIEKLRAICQQMPDYKFNEDFKKPRASDFYDIYMLTTRLGLDFSPADLPLLKKVFEIKEVDLELLFNIPAYKDFYEQGIPSLKDTIPADKLEDFDFDIYFEFVINIIRKITS